MRYLQQAKTHTLKHIWEQYAKEFLIKNPDCYGKSYNKIKNYYIFNNNVKKRRIKVVYKNSTRTHLVPSMAGLVTSYENFKNVATVAFKAGIKAVIEGESLKITSVGKLCVTRVERDFRKTTQLKVNWNETNKQEKVWNEEKQKYLPAKRIFFVDDDWVRICWFKSGIANDRLYEFAPAKENSKDEGGFIGELNRRLRVDPLLKFIYLYRPIKDEVKSFVKRVYKNEKYAT